MMRVLVAYASRHGATQGIAERITSRLRARGLTVELRPVRIVEDVDTYDAFVIGSGAYMGRWLKEATSFVRQHAITLAAKPNWLFSSGPVGTERVDAKGRDVVEAAKPAEFAEFASTIRPCRMAVFYGAFDPDAPAASLAEWLGRPFMRLPAARAAMPKGDFRDWPAIDAWADSIAEELARESAAAAPQPVEPEPVGAGR